MKKIVVFICCFMGCLASAWGCSYFMQSGSYVISDGEVYYRHDRDSEPILVEGADVSTFLSNAGYRYKEVKVTTATGDVERYYSDGKITFPEDQLFEHFDLIIGWYDSNYASDAVHVYYKGKMLRGLDSAQAVFLKDQHGDGRTIEGIEQPRLTRDGYVKDYEEVYYHGNLLEGANGKQLRWMPLYQKEHTGKYYVMDDQQIYFYGSKVAGNPRSAFELKDGYYLDDKHIYFRGDVL